MNGFRIFKCQLRIFYAVVLVLSTPQHMTNREQGHINQPILTCACSGSGLHLKYINLKIRHKLHNFCFCTLSKCFIQHYVLCIFKSLIQTCIRKSQDLNEPNQFNTDTFLTSGDKITPPKHYFAKTRSLHSIIIAASFRYCNEKIQEKK